jgi:hypothetical protein
MKLKLLAAACALTFGSQAQAQNFSIADAALATTQKIYMSGASAQIGAIEGLFDKLCVAGTRSKFTVSSSNLALGCTIDAGVVAGALGGKKVLLSYNSGGGSGNGVFPVAKQTSPVGPTLRTASNLFRAQLTNILPANCSGTAPAFTCTTAATTNVYSDAGVSDLEPALMKFALNKPPAFAAESLSDSDIGQLDLGSQNQVIFGITASKALFDELALAQGVALPSLPYTAIASILSGKLNGPDNFLGWRLLFPEGYVFSGATGGSEDGEVGICRRVNGSGTQATSNVLFLNYGCAPTAAQPVGASASVPGNLKVTEGSDNTAVKACLTTAHNSASNKFAIGLQSLENLPSVDSASVTPAGNTIDKWAHIAIDGVAPTRANVKAGLYPYVVEQTMFWNNNYLNSFRNGTTGAAYALAAGVSITDIKTFLTKFRATAGDPLVLDSITFPDPSVRNGYAAIASATYIYNDADPGAQGLANKEYVSRGSRGGDSCKPMLWNN